MNSYLEKHRFCERQIKKQIASETSIIVVIPCYNESELLETLQSLFDCEKAFFSVEVIVVINSGEHDDGEVLKQSKKTFTEVIDWINNHQHNKLLQ